MIIVEADAKRIAVKYILHIICCKYICVKIKKNLMVLESLCSDAVRLYPTSSATLENVPPDMSAQ